MFRKLRLMGVVCGLIALMSFSAFAAGDKFVSGTVVGGINLSGQTVETAKSYIEGFYSDNFKLKLVGKNGVTEELTGADIGLKIQAPGNLADILGQQQSADLQTGPNITHSYDADGEMRVTYSEDALRAKLSELSFVKNGVKTQNASITPYQQGTEFRVIEEVYGTSVDMEKLTQAVKEALTYQSRQIDLETQGIYDVVTVTAASLQPLCEKMNQIKDMQINYRFGDQTETLSGGEIVGWITGTEGSEIGVDREKAAAYVASLAAKHDTAGGVQTWKSASGRDASIQTSYGWKIDQAAETDALIGMIRTATTQDREPAWAKKGNQWGMPQWGGTFVEVDLTNQHVYFYQDMQCVWDAPTVTGLKTDPDRVTPPGVFAIYSKERNRVLRGRKDPKTGKPSYESPVSYWMPFNGGIGLHDANWRDKFGGTIYTYAGSHGCINLPVDKAPALYDLVSVGTPVVVYE